MSLHPCKLANLEQRALAAYFRAARAAGALPEQPTRHAAVVIRDGAAVVTLSNINGPLAVFRQARDGCRLRRVE